MLFRSIALCLLSIPSTSTAQWFEPGGSVPMMEQRMETVPTFLTMMNLSPLMRMLRGLTTSPRVVPLTCHSCW